MKKKFFIGIAMSLFAVATVFNMNISNQNDAGDVSLDAIEVMAQAQSEGGGIPGYTSAACWEQPGYSCRTCNYAVWPGFQGSYAGCWY